MLALTGKAIEGEVLTAIEVIPKSDAQQKIWQNYKKHVRYQWYSSKPKNLMLFYTCNNGYLKYHHILNVRYMASEIGNNAYEPVHSQCSCSYKLRFDDIGRRFKCECIVTDTFGRSSEPAYVETAPVSPGLLQLSVISLQLCSNMYVSN